MAFTLSPQSPRPTFRPGGAPEAEVLRGVRFLDGECYVPCPKVLPVEPLPKPAPAAPTRKPQVGVPVSPPVVAQDSYIRLGLSGERGLRPWAGFQFSVDGIAQRVGDLSPPSVRVAPGEHSVRLVMPGIEGIEGGAVAYVPVGSAEIVDVVFNGNDWRVTRMPVAGVSPAGFVAEVPQNVVRAAHDLAVHLRRVMRSWHRVEVKRDAQGFYVAVIVHESFAPIPEISALPTSLHGVPVRVGVDYGASPLAPAGLPTVPVEASFNPQQMQEVLARLTALQAEATRLNTTLAQLSQTAAQQGPQLTSAAREGATGLNRIGENLPGFSGAVGEVGTGLQRGAASADSSVQTVKTVGAVLLGLGVAGAVGTIVWAKTK